MKQGGTVIHEVGGAIMETIPGIRHQSMESNVEVKNLICRRCSVCQHRG